MSQRELNRILYVEDEPDIRTVARMALEMVGKFTVHLSESGPIALRDAPGFNPDLILLDVMMPDMDGPTTLKALRQTEAFAKTPVIFMTAKVQPNEVQEYLDLGAIGVIAKPFDPIKLASEIRTIWETCAR